jgi:spermidine synthase
MASMIDEVAWTRALVQVVGPSTYAFSVMLAVFLAGIALGSAVATRLLPRIARPRLGFGLVEAFAGGTTLLAVLSFEPVQILYRELTHPSPGGRGPLSLGMKTLAAGALLGPTTFLLGAAFPLATAAWVRSGETVGRRVGVLYGSNTLGCIAGSLAAGFFLVPNLGIDRSLQVAAALNVAVAAALFATAEGISVNLRWAGFAVLALVSAALGRGGVHWDELLLSAGVEGQGAQLLFEQPGYSATVTVTQQDTGWVFRALRTDGKVDGSDVGDLNTQVQLGLLPMLFHDHPERVLEVGLATGTTCGSTLRDPRVKHVDILEIEKSMVSASHFFDAMNGRPLEDPRTRVIEIDARNYYRASDQTYDVIISEPSNPWMSGPSHLFTQEAFREAHDRLAPGGVMLQWVQGYEMGAATGTAIAAAFRKAFPYVRIFLVHDIPDLLLMGSDAPLPLDLAAISRRLALIRPELHRASIDDAWDLMAEAIADQTSLDKATQGAVPNSDDNGRVEFGAPWDLDAPPRVREAISSGYPGPYAELERQGQSPEVIGGRLGWRTVDNFSLIMADRLTQYLEQRGQKALAQELDASWKVRPEYQEVTSVWQDLLRRQRLWQLGKPQPSAPLRLPLPPDAPESRWLAALEGAFRGPIPSIDFAGPLGAMEALSDAHGGLCDEVRGAAVPFKQLFWQGTGEWGPLRSASTARDMGEALELCGDGAGSELLSKEQLRLRGEMAKLLRVYLPDVPHIDLNAPASVPN